MNIVSKCRFLFIFKHLRAPKRSWKIFHGGPGKSWKSSGFFVSKRVGTLSSWHDNCDVALSISEHFSRWCHVLPVGLRSAGPVVGRQPCRFFSRVLLTAFASVYRRRCSAAAVVRDVVICDGHGGTKQKRETAYTRELRGIGDDGDPGNSVGILQDGSKHCGTPAGIIIIIIIQGRYL